MIQEAILKKIIDSSDGSFKFYLMRGEWITGDDGKVDDEQLLRHKLCRDNCLSIERGYDLNELAERMLEKKQSHHKLISPATFTDGFKKGGEQVQAWLNPKKFTIIQLLDAFKYGKTNDWDAMEKLIDSVEKTEWPVTWKTGETDLKGCLILKLKEE